jgi:hypothetical protein
MNAQLRSDDPIGLRRCSNRLMSLNQPIVPLFVIAFVIERVEVLLVVLGFATPIGFLKARFVSLLCYLDMVSAFRRLVGLRSWLWVVNE